MMRRSVLLALTCASVALTACGGRVADLGGNGAIGNASFAATAGANGVDEVGRSGNGSCAPHAATAYRLVPRRTLPSPVPDPTGIAYDGAKLWILGGIANEADGGSAPTLVRFDPDTLAIDRSFTLGHLIDFPRTTIWGIAWDGQAVWISIVGDANTIVRVDPTTGQVTRTLPSPTTYGPSDLDFDGTDLWLSTGTGDIDRIAPDSGTLEQQFPITPQAGGRDDGIALRPCEVWVGDFFGGMEVHDPDTGDIVGMATNADGSVISQSQLGGACFVGNQLVIANRTALTYYDTEFVP